MYKIPIIINFIIPCILIINGIYFKICPAKRIGDVGYSSRRARASQKSWDSAQKYFPNIAILLGAVSLFMILSITILGIIFFKELLSIISILSLVIGCSIVLGIYHYIENKLDN
ncbi:MAG: SdpI family protein [Peptostreptococcaceae bacterium]|nr:SdpI family protein [Peptostreptococcaceae bacterium]